MASGYDHNYTTESTEVQTRTDYTYTWAACPNCGQPLILNDPRHIGGRGDVRTWQCLACGYYHAASYSEYSEMFALFALTHDEQRRAVRYVLGGFSHDEAIQHALDDAAAHDHQETIASVLFAMAGR